MLKSSSLPLLAEATEVRNDDKATKTRGPVDTRVKDSSPRLTENGYQLFEVAPERCLRLSVTILRGIGVTRGRFKDWLTTPDPYVLVQVLRSPNGQKRTKHVASNSNPEWDETFVFYIDPFKDRLLEFALFDMNRTLNQEIGREIFDFHGLQESIRHNVVISYRNGSKIETQLMIERNCSLDLRTSLKLCSLEEDFLARRREKVLNGLRKLLGTDLGPRNTSEVPLVSVLTSGGGFRALIGYAGALMALQRLGILDCTTYMASLSGSSWYLSNLFTHPDFPHDPKAPTKVASEIRNCITKHWQVHLSPPWSSRYLKKIIAKSVSGQPVSFTDFYGYLVGQQLLKGRMKARLSHQREKISGGSAPMPIYTCLHVKSNVSAKVFQEWYEFTPFEVCIPKYGVSMRTEDFASKFYAGVKVKSFPEVPLHFLYGIWGSAFTILFKRLVQERGRNSQTELIRMILGKTKSSDMAEEEDIIVRCMSEDIDGVVSSEDDGATSPRDFDDSKDKVSLDGEEIIFCETDKEEVRDLLLHSEEREESCTNTKDNSDSNNVFRFPDPEIQISTAEMKSSSSGIASVGSSSGDNLEDLEEHPSSPSGFLDIPLSRSGDSGSSLECLDQQRLETKITFSKTFKETLGKCRLPKRLKDKKSKSVKPLDITSDATVLDDKCLVTSPPIFTVDFDRSRWDRVLERALMTTPFDSRAFRAGVILNPLRGLAFAEKDLGQTSSGSLSPVKPTDTADCDFKGYREPINTEEKKIYMVDSGLSFNLPFPPMLRPQRGVELFITMDFSSRHSDETPPFRELLLAEKWARLHSLPFPAIRDKVKEFLDEPVKECYVFKDECDPDVPVIIFFPLVNQTFRHFSSPGQPRVTDEELAFGDFSIFSDTAAYAIWRFVYPNLSFDRLKAMMAYNIENNLDIIVDEIAQIVERKKRRGSKGGKKS